MASTLDFFQIYYKDEQITELYPFATPYKNEVITDYFENSIISDLVPKSQADFISVCSWRLKRKRAEGPSDVILKRNSTFELTKEQIEKTDFDVAVLTPRSHKDPIEKFLHWHPDDAGPKALAEFDKFYKMSDPVDHVIYENHFIARREIYQDYVKNMLIPAIIFMLNRPVFKMDSGYAHKLFSDTNRVLEYQIKTGRKDWPIAPFILERLFCTWANGKGFKFVDL